MADEHLNNILVEGRSSYDAVMRELDTFDSDDFGIGYDEFLNGMKLEWLFSGHLSKQKAREIV
jgi:hypothetical protein